MEDDALDKLLDSAMNDGAESLEWRNSQPYDGVLGQLLEWVPEWHKNKFRKIRNKLLDTPLYGDQVSHEKIIRWMDDYCELANLQEGALWGGFIPPEVYDDVGYLAHIRYATSLDEEKGLVLLAGDDAVSGYKSRQGHKQRDKYRAKLDYQKQAKTFFEANNYNIAATIKEPALREFRSQHYGAHTLRDWLKEIRPEGMVQKGRPKKI